MFTETKKHLAKLAVMATLSIPLMLTSVSAFAGTYIFTAQFSGAELGNTAVGTETFYVDWQKFVQDNASAYYQQEVNFPSDAIYNISFNVSGASSGNGNFNGDYFLQFKFGGVGLAGIPAPHLGLQDIPGHGYFLQISQGNAPTIIDFSDSLGLVYATDGGKGDPMLFTSLSIAPAPVPEPATYGMLLAGLGMVGWIARRRQRETRI